MTTTKRNLIDKAAREAAIASWDAYGEFVDPEQAYGFTREVWIGAEDEERPELPETRPAEFLHDYRRYCRAIHECNPFIVCDLTRPA